MENQHQPTVRSSDLGLAGVLAHLQNFPGVGHVENNVQQGMWSAQLGFCFPQLCADSTVDEEKQQHQHHTTHKLSAQRTEGRVWECVGACPTKGARTGGNRVSRVESSGTESGKTDPTLVTQNKKKREQDDHEQRLAKVK